MSIVSNVDEENQTGNFDVYVDNVLVSSFLLNVGHEGVEASEVASPVNTNMVNFSSNLSAILDWINLVSKTLNLPISVPADRISNYTYSLTRVVADYSINSYSFGVQEENETGGIIVNPRAANFFTWGEFIFFQRYYREFVQAVLNRNVV